ncbi:hypothetical protein ASPCADRAFT_207125 [Aspergillus carbonarius ITEM 5010]|uniref:Uncharacterized protein n=1 Tax=Aspergillus carbonarius (strain ITEM 5010) TaxID=602072 RepID=A0A1R3RMS4_ASPC5|nr:hypothetical protein ASPCADRAFT_207125 [Aspergillus carbonarius ITEM 5010]
MAWAKIANIDILTRKLREIQFVYVHGRAFNLVRIRAPENASAPAYRLGGRSYTSGCRSSLAQSQSESPYHQAPQLTQANSGP